MVIRNIFQVLPKMNQLQVNAVHNSITILGIYDGHDSGAALVKDGAVLAATSEERLQGIKHYAGTPEKAIESVISVSGVDPSEIDAVALAGRWLLRQYPFLKEGRGGEISWKVKLWQILSPYISSPFLTRVQLGIFSHFRNIKAIRKVLDAHGLSDKEIVFVGHHLAHAATAYRTAPIDDDVLILTCDGSGDGDSSTVSIGRKGEIEQIASSTYYNSICNILYSEVTGYLGMKRWDHEYKVMGLAPYGQPEYCMDVMRRLMTIDEGDPLRFRNISGACDNQVYKKLRNWLEGARFDNIAAAVQRYYEELMCKWVRSAVVSTGIQKIVCAGGGFLNVKANKLISEIPEVESAFFYPASGDEGLAVGAALQGYYEFCKRDGISPKNWQMTDLYYGPSFSEDQIASCLKQSKLTDYKRVEDPSDDVVSLLVQGKIVAWFDGRMEYGPRALGHRSILADPRDQDVKRTLNSQIKMRDWFMPFAPSILEEASKVYLRNAYYAPYMIMAFDTTEKWKDIQAAVHPQDLTARPQIVRKSWNPMFWKTIDAFRAKTGVGAVLNTSFNLHGYPIVCTPEQAIWTFENSKLDALLLGNTLIVRK